MALDDRADKFVVPGDRLGVIEEFVPDQGTYVEDGVIYSMTTGRVVIDPKGRTVSIYPRIRLPSVPRKGSTVLARVMSVQDRSLVLEVFRMGKRMIHVPFSGLLHVSEASEGYVRTISDLYKPGDIVRAKVVSTANRRLHMSTGGDRLGVIYAFCSHSGHLLVKKGNALQCPVCKKVEHRKLASDYGKAIV